ncbi:UNVERIFIED_CONTAM: hypothetical protein HDU68_012785 [Siphonaria sp. JEL0065]|nr:hypothetical protein HDU68_012785 [Siphonaria sp. JEL0065]
MQCHYVILGVEQTADAAALKKAYRAKALELHPDKNPHRIVEATELFALVQNAYQVLNDPHERAWYDSHRDSILRGQDPDTTSSTHTPTSSTSISVNALMKFFSPSAYTNFDDGDPKSFFRVYGSLFERLQIEELNAAETDPDSIFQSDKTSVFEFQEFVFLGDSKEGYPRDFYNRFLTFSSTKSFRWYDKYRLSDAEDRAVRRAMDAQNQKFRLNARREFNETVRQLASHVQKRDPRYKRHLENEKYARDVKAAALKEKKRKEKEEMIKKVEVFEVQDWAKGPELVVEDEDDVVELHEFYCQACGKLFKSDRQWKNHEKSKKHQQNVEELRRQLLEEDELLFGSDEQTAASNQSNEGDSDENGVEDQPVTVPSPVQPKGGLEALLAELDLSDEEFHVELPDFEQLEQPEQPELPATTTSTFETSSKRAKKNKKKPVFIAPDSEASDIDVVADAMLLDSKVDIPNPSTTSKKSKKHKQKSFGLPDHDPKSSASTAQPSIDKEDEQEDQKLSAKEKKRLREAKKAEKQIADKLACSVCRESFVTRNQLFEHLEDSGHAIFKGGKSKKK